MTAAECEIVADAALRLKELRDTLGREFTQWRVAIDLTAVVGMLATLPLTTEPDHA